MEKQTSYLNTDLDLESVSDLTALTATLSVAGVDALRSAREDNGVWYATFEVLNADEPEPNIAEMLTVIETLPPELKNIWDECRSRVFNIGYECGLEPWAFNQTLSQSLLARIASVGASLKITLYPAKD